MSKFGSTWPEKDAAAYVVVHADRHCGLAVDTFTMQWIFTQRDENAPLKSSGLQNKIPFLQLRVDLTRHYGDPIKQLYNVIFNDCFEAAAVDVFVDTESIRRQFGNILRPEWYAVRLGIAKSKVVSACVYFSKLEYDNNWPEGDVNCYIDSNLTPIAKFQTKEHGDWLLKRYLFSRETQYEFTYFLKSRPLAAPAIGFGQQISLNDFVGVENRWYGLLAQHDIENWRVTTRALHYPTQWALTMRGSWRTRAEAQLLFVRAIAEDDVLVIDNEAVRRDNNMPNMSVGSRYLLRRSTWRCLHGEALDILFAMTQLQLPPYVFFEILDWLPEFWPIARILKVRLIEGFLASRKRIETTRENKLKFAQ